MITTQKLALPRSIYIEPTSRCNELCRQCPRTLLSREEDRDLTYDEFRSIVDQFPVLDRVVLHGLGEPLLNKDLPKMIRYLKDRGTYVLFNSNGILLNEKRGQALINAGLDEYRLSMDGATREMYARVRGVDAFDKIWRNVRAFVAMQERPWSGCQRPYSLTYITSSGNVLSCCFAPFGHRSAREYKEERVLGNIFQESIEEIWQGERYEAFRRAFESNTPAKHCAQCGLNWSY